MNAFVRFTAVASKAARFIITEDQSMAHGYMREFDEGYDRGEDRGRDWRDRDDGRRDWRGQSEQQSRNRDQDRGFMFGNDQGRYHPQERQRWREGTPWENNRDWPQTSSRQGRYGSEFEGSSLGDYGKRHDQAFGRENEDHRFRSHPDDHYRSWRQQQIDALDRDYADYCREREQQFHHDFDNWRQNRQPNREATAGAAEGELELTHERAIGEEGNTPSPMSEATLGTNNSENTFTGRNRRSS